MERIQEILTTIDNWLWGNWLLFVLLAVGILYTVISGGVQVRHFKYIIKKTLIHPIRYGDKDTNSEGSVSSFQALNMAIASCVGSGNIVGVATAVLAGGGGGFPSGPSVVIRSILMKEMPYFGRMRIIASL